MFSLLLKDLISDFILGDPELIIPVESISWDFHVGKKWAESSGVGSRHILPAQVFSFALYLVSLIQTASTPSPVITAFYSIKWVHGISDMKSPTARKLLQMSLKLQSEFWQNLKIKKSQFLLKFL